MDLPMLPTFIHAARKSAASVYRALEVLDGLGDPKSLWTAAEVYDCLERAEVELREALTLVQAMRRDKPEDMLCDPKCPRTEDV